MEVAACSICASPHRAEIEKKDIPGKSAEAISWARKQGVNISKFSLAKHRANHLNGTGNDAESPDGFARISKRRQSVRKVNFDKARETDRKIEAGPAEIKPETQTSEKVTDALFLDTVRDMVYEKLLSGEMELKLESGFKAIEIKSKIAEESNNEKLLLEILNEIRSEELSK